VNAATVLQGAELEWLVGRLQRRLRLGRPLTGTVSLTGATPAERAAVARLLGRPIGQGATLSVPLPTLDQLLRKAGVEKGLRGAIEAVTGAVPDEAAARAVDAAAWADLLRDACSWAEPRGLGGWVREITATGLLRRLAATDPAQARTLLDAARRVLTRLPAQGVRRSVLAAEALGNSHGLDDDRPVTTLVLRAVPSLAGVALEAGPDARRRREAWAAVGVVVGDLSAPVLTLGLPGDASCPTGQAVALWREAGQPVHLAARHLLAFPPRWAVDGQPVWVCENPAVVEAAADRLGTRSGPLVCVSGQPASAALTLLRQLDDAGALLRYHGDFDWPGLRIAARLRQLFRTAMWRMATADYLAASDRAQRSLTGAVFDAPWDAGLCSAMADAGVAVEEELVLDELLEDLGANC